MGPAEMGTLTTLLGLPVSGPMSALTWIARQIANAASQELLDPSRIETALLLLERKLEDGEIDEAAFEAEEDRLLQELAELRSAALERDTQLAQARSHNAVLAEQQAGIQAQVQAGLMREAQMQAVLEALESEKAATVAAALHASPRNSHCNRSAVDAADA